jgi:hypothetical protein
MAEWGNGGGKSLIPWKWAFYGLFWSALVLVAVMNGACEPTRPPVSDPGGKSSETASGEKGSEGSDTLSPGGKSWAGRGVDFTLAVFAWLPGAGALVLFFGGTAVGAFAYKKHQARKDLVLADELNWKSPADDGRWPMWADFLRTHPELSAEAVVRLQGVQLADKSRDLVHKGPNSVHYAPRVDNAGAIGAGSLALGGDVPGECPSWMDLWQNGDIGRSGLALGWTLEGLVGGDLELIKSIGLLGMPGGGKTVTMANWIGQLVLQRARVLTADIDARNDEGLGARVKPLWPWLWHAEDAPPIASSEDEMAQFVEFLDAKWRQAEADGGKGPLTVIVIDEVPTAFANDRYGEALITIIGEIIMRGRKYNWFVILGGQDWNKSASGGTIRDQLNTRVFHKADRDQARRFSRIDTKAMPPDVGDLEPGVAYVAGHGPHRKIKVPFVTIGDFEAVASFLTGTPQAASWSIDNELAPTMPNELLSPARALGVASQYAIASVGAQRLNGTLITDEQVRDWVLEAGLDGSGELARDAAASIVHKLCEAEGKVPSGRAWDRNKTWLDRVVEEVRLEGERGHAG